MRVRAERYAGLPGAHDVPPPRPHRQDIPPGEAGHLNVSFFLSIRSHKEQGQTVHMLQIATFWDIYSISPHIHIQVLLLNFWQHSN